MSKTLSKYLIILVLALNLLPAVAAAACAPSCTDEGAWCVQTVFGLEVRGGCERDKPMSSLVEQLLGLLYAAAGASAVIMVAIGGYRYITSGGDQKATQEAKDTIRSAITGLVMILIAYLIAEVVGSLFKIQLIGGEI